MIRADTGLERALLAVAAATGVALVATANGDSIVAGDVIAIATAVGVAVYAAGDGDCNQCT